MCMKTTKDLYKRFKEKVLVLYKLKTCEDQEERPDIIHINVRDLHQKETEVDILLDRFK